MVASVVGFLGNEGVAIFRIRVGRQIGSAALIADGHHARVDGWTSLAVFIGALGVWAGYSVADPVVGLLISAAIFVIVWQSARVILLRVLDGVDPEMVDAIRHAAGHVAHVEEVTDVRARWIGHRVQAEVSVTVSDGPPRRRGGSRRSLRARRRTSSRHRRACPRRPATALPRLNSRPCRCEVNRGCRSPPSADGLRRPGSHLPGAGRITRGPPAAYQADSPPRMYRASKPRSPSVFATLQPT